MPISRTVKIIAQSGVNFYDSEYTVIADGESNIPINIAQLNAVTDYLEVRHENLILEKNENYTINENGTHIDLINWSLAIGDKISFKVMKNINIYPKDNSTHITDVMPHQFTDISTSTVYQYGLKTQDDHLIFSFEEVV